jgi:hypothetical protein
MACRTIAVAVSDAVGLGVADRHRRCHFRSCGRSGGPPTQSIAPRRIQKWHLQSLSMCTDGVTVGLPIASTVTLQRGLRFSERES